VVKYSNGQYIVVDTKRLSALLICLVYTVCKNGMLSFKSTNLYGFAHRLVLEYVSCETKHISGYTAQRVTEQDMSSQQPIDVNKNCLGIH
jgi:hypothetical protein